MFGFNKSGEEPHIGSREHNGNPGGVGHPVTVWPGWVTNDARNNGADVNPIQVQPWHYGNFAATQTQLSNGLKDLSFGRRLAYDGYLRMLYSSASMDTKHKRQILPTIHPSAVVQPSQIQLAQMVTAAAPYSDNTGGTGQIAPGVDLSRRTYYG